MKSTFSLSNFGQTHFGTADLGDRRRTARLVACADRLQRHPGGTLPDKFQAPADLKAFYRATRQLLCDCKNVTHKAVLQPHVEKTLQQILQCNNVVLVLHDTTTLDYSGLESARDGLGQVGDGNGFGYLDHNSLAVDFPQREVIGLTGQILHCRDDVLPGETKRQCRLRKSRESRLWLQGTKSLPANWQIVDVADRGGDTFEFLEHEYKSGRRFVVRSTHNRLVWTSHTADQSDGPDSKLHDNIRTKPSLGTRTVNVPGGHGRKKREAILHIAATSVLVRAPHAKRGEHGNEPLPLWIVRVWEPNPPAGEDPLEWFLLTNQPCETFEKANEVVAWYECRWIIEEYHKAQKTGCGIETLQFAHVDRLQPAIALLSVVALTLLKLRDAARRPDAKTRRAVEVVSQEYVEILSGWRHHRQRSRDWSVHDFYLALARLGGHQNRKHDAPPGWLVLWRGWTKLETMRDGAEAWKTTQKCG